MRVLIHSNGPNVPTGYGVQTALLAERLVAAGHEVAISAYFGQAAGIGEWHGIRVYPGGFEAIGNDIISGHADHWFRGDPSAGWIITLTDVFGLHAQAFRDWQVAAWTPVDHFPVPDDVVRFLAGSGAVPIAFSRWGQDKLIEAGFDALYVPLAYDPAHYRPTEVLPGGITARQFMSGGQWGDGAERELPDDAYIVIMNGMNKGWHLHRKGFPDAFLAFARFASSHPDAVLYLHTEQHGMGGAGIKLVECAVAAGVPQHQLLWVNQYAWRIGVPAPAMAACYTAADVLLAPSMGEGFCVPLIEAQACGTPVIVTDFSAQPELVGAGWKVSGEPWWDATQHAWMIKPSVAEIGAALEAAYDARGDQEMCDAARAFAAQYEADSVFTEHWCPVLDRLDYQPPPLELERRPMERLDVLVPFMRHQNAGRLIRSFDDTNDGTARLVLIGEDITAEGPTIIERGGKFSERVNAALWHTESDWVFLAGDDVEFHPGWIEAARALSAEFDVIGTSDDPQGAGNPKVANGQHADHMFIRRAYIDTYGASLDGPGIACHEGYRHYYVDREIVELAKARGVWSPCLASLVEHHHPGLDKAEGDDIYLEATAHLEPDGKIWRRRAALVAQQ